MYLPKYLFLWQSASTNKCCSLFTQLPVHGNVPVVHLKGKEQFQKKLYRQVFALILTQILLLWAMFLLRALNCTKLWGQNLAPLGAEVAPYSWSSLLLSAFASHWQEMFVLFSKLCFSKIKQQPTNKPTKEEEFGLRNWATSRREQPRGSSMVCWVIPRGASLWPEPLDVQGDPQVFLGSQKIWESHTRLFTSHNTKVISCPGFHRQFCYSFAQCSEISLCSCRAPSYSDTSTQSHFQCPVYRERRGHWGAESFLPPLFSLSAEENSW